MFIAFISITNDSINERFPCIQRSAQNFHAATISRLATNVTSRLSRSLTDVCFRGRPLCH